MKIIYCAYGRAGLECLNQLMLNFSIKKSDLQIFTHKTPENDDFIEHLQNNNFNFTFENINDCIEGIKKFNPNYLLSVYYRFVVGGKILNMVNNNAMNLHPSLLPSYRGAKSSVWAIINNERYTGISFHYMNEELDSGNIILQKKISIFDEDTAFSLYHKLISLFVVNFNDAFSLMINGFDGNEQFGKASYFSRDLPFNGVLKGNEITFKEAAQFVKAMYFPPFKGALFEIDEKVIEINSVDNLKNYIKK